METTVGRFTLDEDGTLTGPADYLREQGNEKLDRILSGDDVAFNMTAHLSPSVEVAILVHLQTDFAGWVGQKQMESWIGGSR